MLNYSWSKETKQDSTFLRLIKDSCSTAVPLIRLRHAELDPVSTQTLQKLDSCFDCMDAGGRATHGAVAERGNDEQAKLLLMSFAFQISETYNGAIAFRHMPYIIWDSSARALSFSLLNISQ